ncbi:unnamed protein product [Lota lota]
MLWMLFILDSALVGKPVQAGTNITTETHRSSQYMTILRQRSNADAFWGKGFLATAVGTASPDRKKTRSGHKKSRNSPETSGWTPPCSELPSAPETCSEGRQPQIHDDPMTHDLRPPDIIKKALKLLQALSVVLNCGRPFTRGVARGVEISLARSRLSQLHARSVNALHSQ